jgi:hypothetical protein
MCLSILEFVFHNCPTFDSRSLSRPFILEMDSFDFALGAILSQIKKDNFLHPIGFCFHKFFPTKINYEIHDKEILAIMDVFQEWHHLFEKVQHEIIMYSNHKNL